MTLKYAKYIKKLHKFKKKPFTNTILEFDMINFQ